MHTQAHTFLPSTHDHLYPAASHTASRARFYSVSPLSLARASAQKQICILAAGAAHLSDRFLLLLLLKCPSLTYFQLLLARATTSILGPHAHALTLLLCF